MSTYTSRARARPTPVTSDTAIDRIRARARFAAVIALLALMGGAMFGETISTLMRPLNAAVGQVDVATHANHR